MDLQCESFHDAVAGKCGAVLRAIGPEIMITRAVLRPGDGPMIRYDHTVRHPGEIRRWREYTYVDGPANQVFDGRQDTRRILVNGEPAAAPVGSVPSYAAHLLLLEMINTGQESITFTQFDDSDPADVHSSEFRVTGSETLTTPEAAPISTTRIQLLVDGGDSNVMWCADGTVIKSDWRGAVSWATTARDQLVEGLSPDVRTAIEQFLDRHGS
ncbi:MAG: hypothetical protein L0G99_15920 [Propionibacteriales bacterium]|nr:hypothetical protein [Propionibacteriales bacterium]